MSFLQNNSLFDTLLTLQPEDMYFALLCIVRMPFPCPTAFLVLLIRIFPPITTGRCSCTRRHSSLLPTGHMRPHLYSHRFCCEQGAMPGQTTAENKTTVWPLQPKAQCAGAEHG